MPGFKLNGNAAWLRIGAILLAMMGQTFWLGGEFGTIKNKIENNTESIHEIKQSIKEQYSKSDAIRDFGVRDKLLDKIYTETQRR